MKHILALFILLPALPTPAAEEKKFEFSEEQLQGLKQQEENYKDNPAMLNVIEQVKKGLGITDEEMTGTPAHQAPPAVEFNASREEADAAYHKKDYATAFKHYQTLAAEGDADASMKLGIMYEGGIGTKKDTAAAHAFYRKAAEGGVDGSAGLLELVEKTGMTDEDWQRTEELYEAIGEQAPDQEIEQSAEHQDKLQGSDTGPSVNRSVLSSPGDGNAEVLRLVTVPERQVNISPEKIKPVQYPKPAIHAEHFQPEKFTHQVYRLPQLHVY